MEFSMVQRYGNPTGYLANVNVFFFDLGPKSVRIRQVLLYNGQTKSHYLIIILSRVHAIKTRVFCVSKRDRFVFF